MAHRLTSAEIEYLEEQVNIRLRQLGPYNDLTRYVEELRAQIKDYRTVLNDIRSEAINHDDRPIEELASEALGRASENFPDEAQGNSGNGSGG
jgi:hypothetical protein